MIKFKKVWGEGFGSLINETKFKLDRPGLNIIIGKNGHGKTTVMSLLNWILFGVSLKNHKAVETWTKFRTETYKGVKGRIKFEKSDKTYEIIRCRDYTGKVEGAKGGNRIVILEDGKDISKRNKGERQHQINEILGYNMELFQNSIIFGQRLKRIIQETGPNKKRVFEEAFEATFLNEAKDKANHDFKEAKEDLLKLTHQFELINPTYENALLKYRNAKDKIKVFEKTKEDNIQALGIELRDIKREIKTHKALVEDSKSNEVRIKTLERQLDKLKTSVNINEIENSTFKAENLVDKVEYEVERFEKKLEGLRISYQTITTKCPRCEEPISPIKIKVEKERIKTETSEVKKQLNKAKAELEEAKIDLQVCKGKLSSIELHKKEIIGLEIEIKKLHSIKNTIKSAQLMIDKHNNDISKILSKIKAQEGTEIEVDLKPLKKSLRGVKNKRVEVKTFLKEAKKKHDDLKWLVTDALSNKGIKAWVFDTMLSQLNNRLKYYTQFIGMRPEFQVDMDSANKDIFAIVYQEDGFQGYYEELSGGQQQLIDVVTAFALHDLMIVGRPVNIMVLDEVFEGLDEENVDIVLDLIQDKAQDKSLFLITHNLALQNSSTKVIRLTRNSKGQTVFKTLEA